MKCKIPEISWHNRDPVLSVDIQPKIERNVVVNVETYRLASGGTDSHVLIWYLNLNTETGELDMDLAADLTRHQRAVNVVKWSPNGQLLASGDDESVIFIWKLKAESEAINIVESTNEYDKETWLTLKILRGHMEDIYDLSWAPNSLYLVSGSVDNTAMLWDVHKGKSMAILSDHKGFVQGVAWDPRNQYIATLCTDRYLRIFDIQTRRVLHRINKSTLPVPAEHEMHEKTARLFHDDTLQTFFRRLCFTPDGKLLITPSGVSDYDGCTHPLHTSYIFSRHALRQPAIVLPSPDQYTVAVGCCPVLYRLRPHSENNPPVVPLPYRMIFAVATRCSVYFYDTQQQPPFAVISNIHYTRLTDITWSHNGRIVVVSSTDGFCSLITFDEGELGEEYTETAEMLLKTEQILPQKSTVAALKKSLKKKETQGNKSMTQKPDEKQEEMVQDTCEEKQQENIKILDKEILGSANKFETPEKKKLPAMPIQIRRQPRTISQKQAISIMTQMEKASEIVANISKEWIEDDIDVDDEEAEEPESQVVEKMQIDVETEEKSPNSVENPKITSPMEVHTESPPLNVEQDKEQIENEIVTNVNKDKATVECNTPRHNYQPPTERTPRRVALRTISTPKSKKKLIEE